MARGFTPSLNFAVDALVFLIRVTLFAKMNRLDVKRRGHMKHRNTTAKSSAGFTLVELLLALSIALIIAMIGMSALVRFDRATSLDGETHIESTGVTRYRETYVSGSPDNEVVRLRRGVTLTYALSGGGSDIMFAKIRGTTAQSGTVTVTSAAGSKIIDIFATGIVSIRTP